MRLPKVVSRQLSNPTGFGGRLIRGAMNRGNAGMNEEAVERLGIEPGARVLDIGFGGGVTFPLLFERGVTVAGIDRSADVVAAAERDNREAIESGRLELSTGSVDGIRFEADSFDGVVTVNTVYFWPDLRVGLGEILRVLRPGGRSVIAIRDGAVMRGVDREVFSIRAPAELVEAMEAMGFAEVRSDAAGEGSRHHICGRKP